VRTLREDREAVTEFMTISCWASVEAMPGFTGAKLNAIHHLPRDAEFLIELPRQVRVLRLRHNHGATAGGDLTPPGSA
jgi:hypothetical protein